MGESPAGHDDDTAADGGATSARLSELGSYIREQRKRAEYSLRHLARVAGVSNPYLSQIERGLRKPSAEILQAIAKALQISSETLYVKAGFLDERAEVPDLEIAILQEDSLTERQRAALIEIYRSFRRENEPEEPDTDRSVGGGSGARR
jgi:transcriptional regulator with XRE-family HTH domain